MLPGVAHKALEMSKISIQQATTVDAKVPAELQECIGSLSIFYCLLIKQWPATLAEGCSF